MKNDLFSSVFKIRLFPEERIFTITNFKSFLIALRDQFKSGLSRIRSGEIFRNKSLLLILVIWIIGVGGDATTTIFAINHPSGLFYEANPGAGFFFSKIGMEEWMIGSSILLVLPLIVLFGEFKYRLMWMFYAVWLSVFVIKVGIAITNIITITSVLS